MQSLYDKILVKKVFMFFVILFWSTGVIFFKYSEFFHNHVCCKSTTYRYILWHLIFIFMWFVLYGSKI